MARRVTASEETHATYYYVFFMSSFSTKRKDVFIDIYSFCRKDNLKKTSFRYLLR